MDPDDLELSSNNTLFTRNFSESARLGFAAFQVHTESLKKAFPRLRDPAS